MPYRAAVWGLLVGLALFVLLLHREGMTLWLALVFGVLFLITPIVTTRMRAETGILAHAFHWQAPCYALIAALGTRQLGAQNLTALSVCFFNRDYRPQQMPHQLEAFKIAGQADLKPRWMLYALLIATEVDVLTAFWVQLHLYYQFGLNPAISAPTRWDMVGSISEG